MVHRKWNVGLVMLWYPLLSSQAHLPMVANLRAAHPGALYHDLRFPPARDGHGMVGSGLVVLNPPYGLAEEAARLTALMATP